MSVRIEILDGTTPLLEKIMLISHGVALESLSSAGAHIQREARASMGAKRHAWDQYVKDGKRRIKKLPSETRELGLRMAASGGPANPASMQNFITSYLMEKSMTVVVGGKHKAFVPNKRVDGEVVGTMKAVAPVSVASHAILHKLNFGERTEHHTWNGKRPSMRRFLNAKYAAQNFMQEGFDAAKVSVEDSMTKRYEKLIHKAVNRAKIKTILRVG